MTRTPKARALGNALRQARQERELTVRDFAARLDRDPGVLSRWESGDRAPKPEHVAQLLTALGVNGDRYDEILNLAYGPGDPSWVATSLPAQRQQLAALQDFERHATKITDVHPLLMPGLLQTPDYIRAIMRGGGVSNNEFAARVSARVGMCDVLATPRPPLFNALIGEGALRQIIGNPEIQAEQLRHLLKLGSKPNIDIRVFRYDTGWHPALEGPFVIIETGQTAVVHLENRKSGLFLHEQPDVTAYQKAASFVSELAMSSEDSMRLVAGMVNRMEKTKCTTG